MMHPASPMMDRKDWMGLLARCKPERLASLLPDLPPHDLLRGPDIGAVMVQGRVGGTGQPFNLGEMTVTRCSLRLEGGAIGHAHVQGRDRDHACRAAVVDGLMQSEPGRVSGLLQRLRAEELAARSLKAAKAAATKVEFFTLVRGEDA